jgi:hypothetical protein
MELIKEYIRSILLEAKVDRIKEKYRKLTPQTPLGSEDFRRSMIMQSIDQLNELDPSPTKKYLEWMVKRLWEGDGLISAGRLSILKSLIDFFHNNTHRFKQKDINQYQSVLEFRQAVEKAKIFQSKRGLIKLAKQQGATQIYEDEEVIVAHIDSKDACMIYGSSTKWCITQKDAKHFERYVDEDNYLFYFILQKQVEPNFKNFEKVAIEYRRDQNNNKFRGMQAWDVHDRDHPVDSAAMEAAFPNLANILNAIKADAETRPMSFFLRQQQGKLTEKETLEWLDTNPDPAQIITFAPKTTSVTVLQRILDTTKSPIVLQAITRNELVTEDMLLKVFKKREAYTKNNEVIFEIIYALVQTPGKLPISIMKKILEPGSEWSGRYVRQAIAKRGDLPIEWLEEMAITEKDSAVIEGILESPNVSEEMIKHIADTPQAWGSIAAFNMNPRVLDHVARYIMDYDARHGEINHYTIRSAFDDLIINTKLSPETIHAIVERSQSHPVFSLGNGGINRTVFMISTTPIVSKKLLPKTISLIVQKVRDEKSFPGDEYDYSAVVHSLGQNKNTPQKSLEILFDSLIDDVRDAHYDLDIYEKVELIKSLILNASTELLEKVYNYMEAIRRDRNFGRAAPRVRGAGVYLKIAEHGNASPDILDKLSYNKANISIPITVAGNPNTLPSTLARLSTVEEKDLHATSSAIWSLRGQIWKNPNTPPKIKEKFDDMYSDKKEIDF